MYEYFRREDVVVIKYLNPLEEMVHIYRFLPDPKQSRAVPEA